MKPAYRLQSIIDSYSGIFCDVWGVIRDGHALLPEAIDALQNVRRAGKPVILVSNSPRPAHDVAVQLAQMGAPEDAWDGIVTSGDATRFALMDAAPGPFFKIGPAGGDDLLYEGLDLEFSEADDAKAIVCTGLMQQLGDEPNDYRDLLSSFVARQVPMICANPDIVVQVGDALIWCAGALARMYRELGGTSIIAGKPHKPIYTLAYQSLRASGWTGDADTILAIGDGPETDLAGANRIGIDAFFVGDGILGADLSGGGVEAAQAELHTYGVSARWFAPRLVW